MMRLLSYFEAYKVVSSLPECKIKWPNDIYLNGNKAGGILVQSETFKGIHTAYIGTGLNFGSINVDE